MTAPSHEGSMDDGVLLALLDGALEGAGRDEASRHLERCAGCARRLGVLERRLDALDEALAVLDEPAADWPPLERVPRRARASRHRWPRLPTAVAAALALLAGVALTPPVRARIAAGLSSLVGAAGTGASGAEESPGAHGSVAFELEGETLRITVDAPQASGSLTVSLGTDARVVARTVGRTDAEELIVGPGSLRIGNDAGSLADYRVTVPATVRSITVEVAGRRAGTVATADLVHGAARRIPLSR